MLARLGLALKSHPKTNLVLDVSKKCDSISFVLVGNSDEQQVRPSDKLHKPIAG
jgi:hypothetical protein